MTSSFLPSRDLISQKQMRANRFLSLQNCVAWIVMWISVGEGGSALPTQLHRSGSRIELVIRLNALAVNNYIRVSLHTAYSQSIAERDAPL